MKKVFSLALTMLLVLSLLLTSCGGNGADVNSVVNGTSDDVNDSDTTNGTSDDINASDTTTKEQETVQTTSTPEDEKAETSDNDATTSSNDSGEQVSPNPEKTASTGLEFQSNGDGTCRVIGIGRCTDTEIIIPSISPEGDLVTGIESHAFQDYAAMTSIIIPDSVTEIQAHAFYNTAFYNNKQNWENGVLYAGNHLIEALDDISGSYSVKPGTLVIANGAFGGSGQLTSITIPNSTTRIGEYAFLDCAGLTDITLGNGIIVIDAYAFLECTELTGISIPNGTTSIGSEAFKDCTKLSDISISGNVINIGENAFYNTAYYNSESNWEDGVLYIDKHLIKAKTDISDSYSIKAETLTIADFAFYECEQLTNVIINDSMMNIGCSAFERCRTLESVTFGNNIQQVQIGAFGNCSNLKSVYISSLDAWFNINFYRSNSNPLHNKGNLYLNNTLITEVSIPDNIKHISDNVFAGFVGLTKVNIHNNVTSIGDSAFLGCTGLTSITIPSSVKNIGDSAFMSCSKLTSVFIYDLAAWCNIDFEGIFSNPLRDAHNLYLNDSLITELSIPNSITEIKDYAFQNCESITSLTIHGGVTSIGEYAFSKCCELSNITMSEGIASIGESAFEYCSKISSLTVPDSMMKIEGDAFKGCFKLEDIILGDNLKAIGGFAFIGTAYYTNESNWEDGVLYIGKHLVDSKSDISGAYSVKEGTLTISRGAFASRSDLTSITIPSSVKDIGDSAFLACTGVTNLIVESGNSVYHSSGNCLIETETKTLIFGFQNATIPDDESVKTIKERAFIYFPDMTTITIPCNITSIGSHAFFDCSKLTDITYNGTKTQWNDIDKGADWYPSTDSYTVHCADGDISKTNY